jgi:DNA/RNA endonuclease YhcR with UshA esterase domain
VRDVGDVRQLEGKTVEVHGKIQQYGGRAEIVLKDVRQLKGEAAQIPPAPKEFDASRRGKFSPKAKN